MGNAWGVTRFKRVCDCHPEQRHYANGLCRDCYRRQPKFAEMRRRYYQANREQWKAHTARSIAKRTKQVSAYGVPASVLDAMLERQGGRCALCGDPPKRKRLALDHCHRTGQVREFLCHACNGGLGLFRDDPERLTRAIAYLRRHEGQDSLHPAPVAAGNP